MIRPGSKLTVMDNSGAVTLRCIRVLKPKPLSMGSLGDRVVASVVKTKPTSAHKRGDVVRAVILSTKTGLTRQGMYMRHAFNGACLINAQGDPLGTRVLYSLGEELRERGLSKFRSMTRQVI